MTSPSQNQLLHEVVCTELAKTIGKILNFSHTLKQLQEELRREGVQVLPKVKTALREYRSAFKKEKVLLENLYKTLYTNPYSFDLFLKNNGSPARVDTSIHGGICTLTTNPIKIRDQKTLIEAYEKSSTKDSMIWDSLRDLKTYTRPKTPLQVYFLSYDSDQTVGDFSDKIVADLDKVGLRPATVEELLLLGAIESDVPEKELRLIGLTKYTIKDNMVCVPILEYLKNYRQLRVVDYTENWDNGDRFVCVRK
jgi:hypothetical protein